MLVRPARPNEAGALTRLALRSKASWGYDGSFMSACVQELTVRPSDLSLRPTFVAEARGRSAGFYQLLVEGVLAEVTLLFVEPEAQGSGVGRLLWRHLEAEAVSLGARRIAVVSDPNAAGFYLRMGTRRAGCRPSASLCGRMLPRFVKDLPGRLMPGSGHSTLEA